MTVHMKYLPPRLIRISFPTIVLRSRMAFRQVARSLVRKPGLAIAKMSLVSSPLGNSRKSTNGPVT